MSKTKIIKEAIEESPELVRKIIRSLKGGADDATAKLGSGKNLDALKGMQGGLADDIIETSVKKTPRGVASKAPAKSLAETAESLKGSIDDVLNPGMSKSQKLMVGGGLLGLGAAGLSMLPEENVQVPLLPGEKPIPKAETPEEAPKMTEEVDSDKKAVTDMLNKAAKAPKPQKEEQKEEAELDLMKALIEAQRADNQSQFLNDLLRVGIQAGSAISRTKPDYEVANALAKGSRAVAGVQQLAEMRATENKLEKAKRELEDDKKMRDPNSELSKQLRAILTKAGYPVNEKVSAQNIKDMGVNAYNLLSQKQVIDSRQKADLLRDQKNQQAFIDGARKTLLKPFQEFQKIDTAFQSVEQFVNSKPSGPKDVALLYNFIRTLDPGSVVKEGEIALSRKGMSLFEDLGVKAKRITSGQLLSDDFRRGVLEIGRQQRDLAEKNYREIAQPFITNAAGMGMGEKEMNKFDYMSAKKETKKEEAKPETVRVQRLSDGAVRLVPRSSTVNMDKNKYKILD
jgi:hypothetical protein